MIQDRDIREIFFYFLCMCCSCFCSEISSIMDLCVLL